MFPWGDQLEQDGKHHCNVFQGDFPKQDAAENVYAGLSVKAFPANDYQLYGMVGNVWEWCLDWWTTDPVYRQPCSDAGLPKAVKVIKGGSFLCHHSYCNRYRNAARTKNAPMTQPLTWVSVSAGCCPKLVLSGREG